MKTEDASMTTSPTLSGNNPTAIGGRARHSARAGAGMESGREDSKGFLGTISEFLRLGFNRTIARAERRALPQSAFTLLEVMVAVTLMAIIIVGLVVMFNQTSRAFNGSITQVDVLESGRGAADIIAREVEQMTPYGRTDVTNFMVYVPLGGVPGLPGTQSLFPNALNPITHLLDQPLTDASVKRTNILDAVLFSVPQIGSQNQAFSFIGYRLDNYTNGIGSLYRYQMDNIQMTNSTGTNFYNCASNQPLVFTATSFTNGAASNSFVKIIDGVVHFRVRALNTNGAAFGYVYNSVSNLFAPQDQGYFTSSNYYILNNFNSQLRHEYSYAFRNAAVPAYVEIELGVLEDGILKRYNSMTNSGTQQGSIAWQYLQKHAAQVHVFRQRIPVRNANPAAYQ